MASSKNITAILLFLILLIPLGAFFHSGLPLTHDGEIQVARIASFYQSLSEGNFIPRWSGNLNWGYGTPILMFVYPLPSYAASLFHFLGISFIDSAKIIFGLGFVLSGLFMYLWIKEIWGKEAGFAAGILYTFAPYRFVDLYVRGAIGENFAFIWPPLACWLALRLSKGFHWRYLVGVSLSLAALILSHNMLSLMFLPVIFGYLGYLVFISKKKLLCSVHYVLGSIWGLILAAFFWLPALLESKYTLQDIVTKGNITGFESLSRLIWSPWNYGGTGAFSVQLGILQWLAVILASLLIWLFWRKKDKNWVFLTGLLACFCLTIFLILPTAKPLYFGLPLLSKFQFAWRFLSLAILPPAVFAAVLVFVLPKRLRLFCAMLFVLCSVLLTKDYWQAKDFFYKDNASYLGAYPGTTDTGECSPIWSIRFMEKFPKAPAEVIEGKAQIKPMARTSTKQEFAINAVTEARLAINTLYFPGWQILVDGQPAAIEFQDPGYRGLMTFSVPEGEHQVTVQFGETKLREIANLISLLGLGGLVSSGFMLKLLKK